MPIAFGPREVLSIGLGSEIRFNWGGMPLSGLTEFVAAFTSVAAVAHAALSHGLRQVVKRGKTDPATLMTLTHHHSMDNIRAVAVYYENERCHVPNGRFENVSFTSALDIVSGIASVLHRFRYWHNVCSSSLEEQTTRRSIFELSIGMLGMADLNVDEAAVRSVWTTLTHHGIAEPLVKMWSSRYREVDLNAYLASDLQTQINVVLAKMFDSLGGNDGTFHGTCCIEFDELEDA